MYTLKFDWSVLFFFKNVIEHVFLLRGDKKQNLKLQAVAQDDFSRVKHEGA
jgi:hypothetical protein